MPPYPIDPDRSALLLFDLVNAYVYPAVTAGGSPMDSTGLVQRALEARKMAEACAMNVVYTRDARDPAIVDAAPGLTDTDKFLRPWPEQMTREDVNAGRADPAATEIIAELAPSPQDHVLQKYGWSAFAGTALDLLLRRLRVDTLLIAGVATDIGIAATVYDAHDRGYAVVVLRDACQTPFAAAQAFCMEHLFPRMARVMTVEQAAQLIRPPA
jgi:nicotinamidase-related amidase